MIASRVCIAAAFLATLLSAAPAQAQMTSELVGQRVRVHVRDEVRQQAGGSRLELRGRVTSADGDRLVVQLPHATPPVTIARADIIRLDVSRGVPSRGSSAAQGFIGGAVLGALWGVAWHALDVGDDDTSLGRATAGGAIIGASLGTVVGAIWPSERWRRVRVR